jgi:predicted transcriptional regulator
METRVLTAHVPIDLAERVDAYAEQLDRPRGWIIKQALADWVAWEEEKERRTLEALEDGRQGQTVTHEEMTAWAKSLGTDKPLPAPRAK